jgi:hypothetical protein
MTRTWWSGHASAPTAFTAKAKIRQALPAWLPGLRLITSISTALWLWRAVGCGGRGACWSRWSLGLIMAGSPSTRATSPACAATL